MDWQQEITLDPKVLSGKPIVKGTRLSVALIVGHLAEGWSFDDLLSSYPRLTESSIRACLAYAHEILEQEIVYSMVG